MSNATNKSKRMAMLAKGATNAIHPRAVDWDTHTSSTVATSDAPDYRGAGAFTMTAGDGGSIAKSSVEVF